MNPADAYLESMVTTASPVQLIVMLYDKVINLLHNAKSAIEMGLDDMENLKTKAESLSRATDIVIFLQAILDTEKGGEIAVNLKSIYDAFIQELIRINVENDVKSIEEMINIFEDLRSVWVELEKRYEENAQRSAT